MKIGCQTYTRVLLNVIGQSGLWKTLSDVLEYRHNLAVNRRMKALINLCWDQFGKRELALSLILGSLTYKYWAKGLRPSTVMLFYRFTLQTHLLGCDVAHTCTLSECVHTCGKGAMWLMMFIGDADHLKEHFDIWVNLVCELWIPLEVLVEQI